MLKNQRKCYLTHTIEIIIGEDDKGQTVIDPSCMYAGKVIASIPKEQAQEMVETELLQAVILDKLGSQMELVYREQENNQEIAHVRNPLTDYYRTFRVVRKDGKVELEDFGVYTLASEEVIYGR